MEATSCGESQARHQIQDAIDGGALRYRWEHYSAPSGSTGAATLPEGPIYSHTPDYWLTCATDPTDPDRILEPPNYDPAMVEKRTAKRLEKARRYRKPMFESECVIKIWPVPPSNSATIAREVRGAPASSGGLERPKVARIASLAERLAAELLRMFPERRPDMSVKQIGEQLRSRPGVGKFGQRTLENAVALAWPHDSA